MNGALEDVAFLANSENRVAVLGLLVDESRCHDEIRAATGASRVTTARILREFEERGWISRSGQECVTTPTGEWVYASFTRLLDEVAAERRLREPLKRLPADLLTFDVSRLRDAELVVREESDATAIIRRILEFRRSGDRIRGLARMVAPVFIENDWESTVQGDVRLDMVITPAVLDAVRDHSTAAGQLREMLEEDTVQVAVSEAVPISLSIVDDEVGIDVTDDQGTVTGGFVTDDGAVREWAIDLFESCREEARSVAPAEVVVSEEVSPDPSVDVIRSHHRSNGRR